MDVAGTFFASLMTILKALQDNFLFWSLIFLNPVLMVLKLWKVKYSDKGGPYKMILSVK
jgi:hypothetical protein